MPITSIQRDWGVGPSIVRITTTDTFATITANGYLTAQAATIATLNNGAFQWLPTDYVLISYNGGEGFFTPDYLVNNTFILGGGAVQKATLTLTSAQFETLYTAGIQLIPSAGAHTWIVPGITAVEYDYGGTQYAAGGAFGLVYSTAAPVNGAGTAASATEAAATINAFTANNGFTLAGASTGTMATMVNMGVWVAVQTANFTTGNGTFTLNTEYKVYPTTA